MQAAHDNFSSSVDLTMVRSILHVFRDGQVLGLEL